MMIYASRPDGKIPPRPPDMPRELIDELNFHFSGLHRGQEKDLVCLWYDARTKRCKHYEFRPKACRDFELGGDACLMTRKHFGINNQ